MWIIVLIIVIIIIVKVSKTAKENEEIREDALIDLELCEDADKDIESVLDYEKKGTCIEIGEIISLIEANPLKLDDRYCCPILVTGYVHSVISEREILLGKEGEYMRSNCISIIPDIARMNVCSPEYSKMIGKIEGIFRTLDKNQKVTILGTLFKYDNNFRICAIKILL